MAANAWKRYNKFPEYIGDGTIDLDNDTFKVALFLSTSNCDIQGGVVLVNVQLCDIVNNSVRKSDQ
jgi:hypothetical protein